MDIREDIGEGKRGLSLVSSEEEILKDQKKAIVAEFQAQKDTANGDGDDPRKSKKQKTKKEPTREHSLLRESADAARLWEKAMYDKYTEGQAGEILDRVLEYWRKSDFPAEPFHKWTGDLMEDAKTGWRKFKAYREMLDKYPRQNMEQRYCDETDEWVWRK